MNIYDRSVSPMLSIPERNKRQYSDGSAGRKMQINFLWEKNGMKVGTTSLFRKRMYL